MTVAALYVEKGGVYYGLDDVDPWDEERDARLYAGPWPVVAHPPCARWSRFAGFTESRFGYKRGADGGCFAAALLAVRTYGGVIEHPAYSAAWDFYGLPEPLVVAGWTGGLCGGFSAYVEQGRYGLPIKKATWLYAFGVQLPDLKWGRVFDVEGLAPNGRHVWQRALQGKGGKARRSRTTLEFRDALLSMACSALTPCPSAPRLGLSSSAGEPRPLGATAGKRRDTALDPGRR